MKIMFLFGAELFALILSHPRGIVAAWYLYTSRKTRMLSSACGRWDCDGLFGVVAEDSRLTLVDVFFHA